MEINGYKICYVDPEEQINFFVHELKKNAGKKIAFVIHPRSIIFSGGVNLDLIMLNGERHKVETVFVTSHDHSRYLLEQAGFQVFINLDNLEKESVSQEEKLPKEGELPAEGKSGKGLPSSEEKRKGQVFTKITAALFLILFFFTLGRFIMDKYPFTLVEIKPVLHHIKKEIRIEADLMIERPQWEKGIIPLHSFSLAENLEKDFPVMGTNNKGVTRARGEILIFNDTDEEAVLEEGTIALSEDGVEFVTLAAVVVPPREIEKFMDLPVGIKAGQVGVEIEACQPGRRGNVAAGTILSLKEQGNPSLYLINSLPTTGGEDQTVRVVSEEDLSWAERQMREYLVDEVVRNAYRKLSGDYRLIEETVTTANCRISFVNRLGEEAILLKSRGIIEANGFMVAHKILDKALTFMFLAGMDSSDYIPDLRVSLLEVIPEKDKIFLIFEVDASLAAAVNPKRIATALAGVNVEEARAILSKQRDIQSFCIQAPRDGYISRLPLAVRVIIQPSN